MYISSSVEKGKRHEQTLTKKLSLFENNIKQTPDGN